MARKITAYSCEYGCGRRVLKSKSAMERHEKTCFKNPARKACITCKHFFSCRDSNGMESEPQFLHVWIHRECMANDDINLDDKLRHDCELWEEKE